MAKEKEYDIKKFVRIEYLTSKPGFKCISNEVIAKRLVARGYVKILGPAKVEPKPEPKPEKDEEPDKDKEK